MYRSELVDYNYIADSRLCAIVDFSMGLFELRHGAIMEHSVRVANLARAAAVDTDLLDPRAAYIAGLLHDIGKLALPDGYFSGADIDAQAYSDVKQHALYGYQALKDEHLFTALCCGFHHGVQHDHGYGLNVNDMPAAFSPETAARVLKTATLVAICDFVDAAATRTTTLAAAGGGCLLQELARRYPDEGLLVAAVIARQS